MRFAIIKSLDIFGDSKSFSFTLKSYTGRAPVVKWI